MSDHTSGPAGLDSGERGKPVANRWGRARVTDGQDRTHHFPHTGRWTHEEHVLFLQGLKVHGKEWKKISKMIPTRSLVQIRSHAQKYFQKLVQAKEHGIMDAADQESMLLMDGKRMTTGGGSKSVSACVSSAT